MEKLLLTSICKPIGPRYGDAPSVGYELLHGQVTTVQGIFSPRATHLQYGLEFIAANLDTPTTVLQYPSKRQLIRELKKGYEFVGLSFVLSTYHRMKEVVALIREYSPKAKIILGGYGTVIEDELLEPYCDIICRKEGVDFMKDILGEAPRTGSYQHPTVVSKLKILSIPVSHTGLVFAGLGCPNGCDFCCTSYYFRRRHIRLLDSGRDIFKTIEHYQKVKEGMKITILDEDFLLNKKRAMAFGEAVRESGRTLSIFCFASVRALSQYKVEEIVAMGIDGMWIGVEGKRSGYAKQAGQDIETLFTELRSAGVLILASMIVGFDYQTPEIIQEELDFLIAQKPTLSQFLIYGPTPGTPFYDRILKEGRLRPDLTRDREKYFHQCTGFDAMVTHPTLSSEELRNQQEHCFREDFKRLGPSLIRSLECYLNGYIRWRNHKDPLLRNKAQAFQRDFIRGIPLLPLAGVLGPSREARKVAWDLLRNGLKETHIPLGQALTLGISGILAFPAALWTALTLKFNFFQHPRIRRTVYNGDTLKSLCSFHAGKRALNWLDIRLESLKSVEFQPSLQMLQFKGKLDRKVISQFLRCFKNRKQFSLENLIIDLRPLEIPNYKTFRKLLQGFNKENIRITMLVTPDMMEIVDRLKESAFKMKENLAFFINEESLLTGYKTQIVCV